jgi:hypothetical protein
METTVCKGIVQGRAVIREEGVVLPESIEVHVIPI